MNGRECTTCGVFKSPNEFYMGRRNKIRAECKECANEKSLIRYRNKRNEKDVNFYASRMASAAINRCSEGGHRHYTNNGIEVKFRSHSEFTDYIVTNFSDDIRQLLNTGKSPSLDRIDPSGHYEPGNVRIIDLDLNRRLGSETFAMVNSKIIRSVSPEGVVRVYRSVKEASEITGFDRATIRKSFREGRKTRAGYRFYLLDESGAV